METGDALQTEGQMDACLSQSFFVSLFLKMQMQGFYAFVNIQFKGFSGNIPTKDTTEQL